MEAVRPVATVGALRKVMTDDDWRKLGVVPFEEREKRARLRKDWDSQANTIRVFLERFVDKEPMAGVHLGLHATYGFACAIDYVAAREFWLAARSAG